MMACKRQVAIMERLRGENEAALEEVRATVSTCQEAVEGI
jgi:hypothetical protein